MRDQSILFLIITIVCALLSQQLCAHFDATINEVHVGLIVNMESWEGKIAKYSIEMALSDFYREHSHYKTRLVLHTRDSKGQPTRALSAVDAVVGDVTITANRSLYFDFTIPFTATGVGIVALDDTKNTCLFLKPLSKKLWIAILSLFILTGFAVWVIERRINHEFQGSSSQQIGTTLWFAFSTLVYAHREKLVNNLSKFIVIVWLFVVFVLNSSYTATLASMMTVKQLQLDPKYSFIGLPMANSTLSEIVSQLNVEDFRSRPYLYSPNDYANALSNGSKNGGVSAIIDETPYLNIFLAQYANQNFYLAGTKSTTNGFGFVFRKGSPLVSEMLWAIEKLREEETLKKFEDEWLYYKR